MRVTALSLILCLFLQSCSMTFNTFSGNREIAAVEDFNGLFVSLRNYKSLVMGSEVDAKCTKAQVDAEFNKMMSSLKKNSCSETNFEIDKEAFTRKQCPPGKKEGYFDLKVKETITAEKSKKTAPLFQAKTDLTFNNLMMAAISYFKATSTYLNSNKYSVNDRAQLLSIYIENVLLPVRDLIVMMRSYQPKENTGKTFYESLQPFIKADLYAALSTYHKGLITQGPNPMGDPFYMQFQKQQNGSYRVIFSENDIIRRDVVTLLKAPTAKNYVMALKWMTLHMMTSQIYLYNTILGNKEDMNLPLACQNQFNGDLPKKLKFAFEDGIGDEFLENILAGHGLTYSEDDISYLDYYIDNENKNPTQEGYSGLVPFENYKSALRSSDKNHEISLTPHFDDVAHFQTVLNYKMPEVQAAFRGKIKGQEVLYVGHEIFNKILGDFPVDEIATVKISKNESIDIYPGKQNLSPYLLEIMQDNGVIDFEGLITERMKKKMVGKKVLIDFPSLYSSPVWRDWSLRYLADVLEANKGLSKTSAVYTSLYHACGLSANSNKTLLEICRSDNILVKLSSVLSGFQSGDTYIPTRRLEEAKYRDMYPLLRMVWLNLRDKFNMLPEATPFELNFLLDQMSAGNPWARLKLGYMVAIDRIEHKMGGNSNSPVYYYSYPAYNYNPALTCSMDNLKAQLSNIQKAGKTLSLDERLSYNHSAKVIGSKNISKVWGSIRDDINQRNAQLFSVKQNNKTFYTQLEDISYKTILNQQRALAPGVTLSAKATNEIKKVAAQSDAQLADFFLTLYKTTDRKKQQELFEKFSAVNGIDNTFSLKLNFLAVDDAYKKPIYKDIIRKAAQARKNQIASELTKFCGLSLDNEDQFKNIFYSTTKAQNELNQMAGLPSIPPDVLEKINSMTSSEWRDLWLGIGSGVAGVAAIVIGGACTTLSGGLCAPLGGVMAAAGVGAIGMQMKLTSNEYARKKESDASAAQIKIMEELGFSDSGSHKEVERSYAWTAFEAITIFPLIGVATRAISLGPKIVYASTKSMMRQTGKAAFKSAARKAIQEEEVKAAHYLLGFSEVAKNTGLDAKTIKNAQDKINRIRTLFTKGEISMEEMAKRIAEVIAPIKRAKTALAKTTRVELGKIHVKESKDKIDAQTAKMIAQYFGDNPKEMLRLVQGYSGEKLVKAQRAMGVINDANRVGGIPIWGGVKDWYLKLRYESLSKNASKILKLEKELKALGGKPQALEAYIKNNIEDITDIFIEIPLKKREIPYFIFVQGMPHFNFMKNMKTPLLSAMSEGQILKKVVTARARLVHESYKAQARITLKLKKYVNSETTFHAFKAFQGSVAEMANKQTAVRAKEILAEYKTFEDVVVKKLYSKSPAATSMKYDDFKKLVMNPKNINERAKAEAIWESVPADELMGMKEVGTFAHKAVQELSNYSNIDSFERYLSALRVLTINRNAAVLEIM